jgi:hypothetical protein
MAEEGSPLPVSGSAEPTSDKPSRRPILGPIDPSLLDDPQFADLWSSSEASDLVIPEISAADLWADEDPDAPPIP